MPSTYCCVPFCKNKGGHLFPKDKPLMSKWIHAIKRKNWKPSFSSVVCKNHFQTTDYIKETIHYGTPSLIQRLHKNVVPSKFHWTREETAVAVNRKHRYQNRENNTQKQQNCSRRVKVKENICPNISETPCISIAAEITLKTSETLSVPVSTQTDNENDGIKTTTNACSQTMKYCPFSIMTYKNDPQSIHFFTGLECFEKVFFVFESLGDVSQSLKYFYGNPPATINPFEQFFLTLIILRTHKTFFEISKMWMISIKDVSNIFITWIKFMSLQWKELDLWSSRSMVIFFSPADFYSKYPNTRMIIDGTECPIIRPALPTAQQASFSTYKNKNTVKVLIGCTPNGLINYVSPSYAGSASDRQIIECGNLPSMCDPGDSIMADKGFNVQDIFAPYGVTINIPTFFKKSNKINNDVLKNDRKISSKRVHIERVVGLVKTYKILKSPMNHTETMLSSDIIFICCMLANFRSTIISEKN